MAVVLYFQTIIKVLTNSYVIACHWWEKCSFQISVIREEMRPQRNLISEVVLAVSPVLRALRSHPAPLLRSRASIAEVAFSLLHTICSLNIWKGVLWSEWESEPVIWLEELVSSLVLSLSLFRSSSGFSAVQNVEKAILLRMIGRSAE